MERDLVEQAQRGDREAFAILARTRGDVLFGTARRIVRDVGIAEDAVQQTLVIGGRSRSPRKGSILTRAMSARFWDGLDNLVSVHRIVIDRPRGSAHPRYPDWVYPLDYGYLDGTTSGDGAGIDVWRGSLPEATLTAVLCCVDRKKRDVEIKLLVGCSRDEVAMIAALHDDGEQAAAVVERDTNSDSRCDRRAVGSMAERRLDQPHSATSVWTKQGPGRRRPVRPG